jgi:hypothetical protein
VILTRHQLTLVLNALYESGTRTIPVSHPCDEVGELLRIELGGPWDSTVRFTQGASSYQDTREAILRTYGERPHSDLPDENHYVAATIAGGLTDVANQDEIEEFVQRHGYPDLEAGHRPVFVGIDTNLFPWRMQDALGVDPTKGDRDEAGRAPTNGFALATGVKEELDWHFKHYDTDSLTRALGEEFDRLSNQPAGDNRQGFLGLYEYRRLMADRRVDVVETGMGDDAIVEGYATYADEERNDLLLFSNDYGFVDDARDAGLLAQHVDVPVDLPRRVSTSWWSIENTLYYLAVIFGVLRLPKVTLYGVWNGKTGRHWQNEQIDVVSRSPKVEPQLKRDMTIARADTA